MKNNNLIISKLRTQVMKLERRIMFLKNENIKLKKEIEVLKKQAYTDSLTKLNNRRTIENVSGFDNLILGDIDFFKSINDNFGHDVGDKVLVEIGIVLKKYVRETDLVCRWGGEEFIILLKDCNDDDAYDKAELLKDKVMELSEKFGFKITMSFGISNLSNKTMENAIKDADTAMYQSKHDGRNRVTMYQLVNKSIDN